jgi:cyclic pyranopterin phosphate synthase
VRVGISLGIKKVRVTGGEPLVRKGIIQFLQSLSSLKGLKDLAITTNGVLLKHKLAEIREAGIRRINISLDTLKRDRFRLISGIDKLNDVLEAIQLAEELGFDPIKVNMVVMKNVNEDEIEAFAKLSLDKPYHIRFIEYMPIGSRPGHLKPAHIPSEEIKRRLEAMAPLERVRPGRYDGPAERYRFEGARGEVGFISPMTNHFCASCNRLRLTAEGRIRPCLLSDRELDIKAALRSGATDENLAQLLKKATSYKPKAHSFVPQDSILFPGEMSTIGG